MGFVDWVQEASAFIAAGGVVLGAVIGFLKVLRRLGELRETLAVLVEHDADQYLSILRLTVMNESMPISERVIAGRKYIDGGGNGAVKKYYEDYLSHLHKDN